MSKEVNYTKKLDTLSITMKDNADDDYEMKVNVLYVEFEKNVWMSHYKKQNSWLTCFWHQENGSVLKQSEMITRSSLDHLEDRTKRRLIKHLIDFDVVDKPRVGLKLLNTIIDELTSDDKEHLHKNVFQNISVLDKKDALLFRWDGKRKIFNSEAVANAIIHAQREFHNSNILAIDDDTKQLYLYENGVYNKSITDIEIQIRNLLGNISCTHYVNETLRSVRMKCMMPRSEFNKENGDINMSNGIFNYNTQSFRPHSREDLFTNSLDIEYDPDAECENIMTFLEWAQPNPKNRFMIMEETSYMYVNGYPIQRLYFWQGPGANGKGVMMNQIIAPMLGKDNISYAALQDLEQDKNYSQQSLYGKKLNMCGDIPGKNTSFDFVNKATGGDGILVRNIYSEGFTLYNFAKFLFTMNKIPGITNFSEGPLRRLIVTPWYSTKGIDGKPFSKKFMDSLSSPEELSGFFNVLMKLIPPLLKRGDFKYAPSVEQTHIDLENLKGVDITSFLTAKFEYNIDEHFPLNVFYELYQKWCKTTKDTPKPMTMVQTILKENKYKIEDLNGIKIVAGLRFVS